MIYSPTNDPIKVTMENLFVANNPITIVLYESV